MTALNAHLAGRTGMVDGRETGLTFHDEERAVELTSVLRRSRDDVFGLTEVWDQGLGQALIDGVRENFPYSVYAPCANGIGDALSYLQNNLAGIWPGSSDYLKRKTQRIVDEFSKNHYQVGRRSLLSALRVFVPEDWVFWPLSRALREPLFWGAGLLLLSRHPLDNVSFTPFTARADLERFAGKGILQATVRPADAEPLDIFLTHYQEGISRHARMARSKQILQTRERVLLSPRATAVMGDMNIDADTEEYRLMLEALPLRDAFRAAHPDPRSTPGYTFDYDNPFTRKQLGDRWGQRRDGQADRQRIDYILAALRLPVVEAQVLRFMASGGAFPVSDHDAVRVAVALGA